MIKDRGNIKWTAMMLPEHVGELRKWMNQANYTERPELNVWELQSIQEELELAYKRKCETVIKTWVNGRISQDQGIVKDIEVLGMCIVLKDSFGSKRISVANIISVYCID